MSEEESITMFMNLDKHGCLINYSAVAATEYYIRYVDNKPIDGVLPKGLDRVYDYKLHQWLSIPGRPPCNHFGQELPYCENFESKELPVN